MRTRTWSAGNRGFTLLELLLVLVILGLIMGLVMPRFGGWSSDMELRREGAKMMLALGSARLRAVKEGERVVVKKARDGQAISVMGSSYELPSDITVSRLGTRGDSISFYPDGSADGGFLELSGSGGRLRVVVNPLTGRTSLEKISRAKGGGK